MQLRNKAQTTSLHKETTPSKHRVSGPKKKKKKEHKKGDFAESGYVWLETVGLDPWVRRGSGIPGVSTQKDNERMKQRPEV